MYHRVGCRGPNPRRDLAMAVVLLIITSVAALVRAAAPEGIVVVDSPSHSIAAASSSPVLAGSSADVCDAPNSSFDGGLDHCECYEVPDQTICSCPCSSCQVPEMTVCNKCDLAAGTCSECNCVNEEEEELALSRRAASGSSGLRGEIECHEAGFQQKNMDLCRCTRRGPMTICACVCNTCTRIKVQECMQCNGTSCGVCRCFQPGIGREPAGGRKSAELSSYQQQPPANVAAEGSAVANAADKTSSVVVVADSE
eukprot:GHVS01021132.1.p1 GENE.GHVS01021132.1~~GHVS01021132.1.p1  ORF type:complete len:255 (-),score=42.29 GHVS01021132.1:364-1128(-)